MSSGSDLPSKIGRYTIKRKLGEGGQGAVYLAFDPNFNIDVAVKVLHPEFRAEEFLDRFKVDAQTAARLNVPNVVRVYDFDLEYPYLVMEYCGDGDLNRYIKSRRRRSLRDILTIARQICEALVAAHENDPPILHRDIKPGNVLFQKGVPKVTDFGLAKMLSGGAGLTTTRGMMGTVRYCSPEQLRDASRVDHRADLWSAGVVLYELLTWTRPFDKPGDSDPNIMLRVIMEAPRQPPYEVPGPVMSVIGKALQKEPDARFRSAREMRDAVDRALASVPGAEALLLPPESLVDDLSRMASQVASFLDEGHAQDASVLIRDMRKRSPDDSLVSFWHRRLKERSATGSSPSPSGGAQAPEDAKPDLVERLDSIQSHIEAGQFTEARRAIGTILVEHPDNSVVHRALEKLTERERRQQQDLEQVYREADEARRKGDPAQVYEAWRRFNAAYPRLAVAQGEMAVARQELAIHEQRKARDSAKQEADRLLGAGDLRGAVAAWQGYTDRYPTDQEAARAEREIRAALQARERAERITALDAETTRLRGGGDLEGALELWVTYLGEDPAAAEAARRVERLRSEISARTRERRLHEARSAAAACVAAQDYRGAARAWERFAVEYPDEAEARQQIESLGQRVAEEERQATLQEVQRLLSSLSARYEGQRYRSLPGVQPGIARALEKAHAALTGDLKALAAAKGVLVEAQGSAEAGLSREIASHRGRLQALVDEHRDWLAGAGAGPDREGKGADEGLQRAFLAALGALCGAHPPGASRDPLEPLVRAEKDLSDSAAALAKERQQAVEAARARARTALGEAQAAVRALGDVAGDGGSRASGRPALQDFEERLGRLQAHSDSNVPGRLTEVAHQAAALRAEADALRMERLWGLARELGRLADEGRRLTLEAQADRLSESVHGATKVLAAGAGGPEDSVATYVAARDELVRAIAATREAQDERLARARERWQKALKAWRDVLAADLGTAEQKEGRAFQASGEAALAASRSEELEGWAAQLEGLTRRYRLESAWIEQSNALLEIEGPLDHDGLPREEGDPEAQELLARYRKAMASGNAEAVRALAPTLQAQSRDMERGGDGPDLSAVEVPVVSRGVRRFNETYAPAMLRSFDELAGRYENSRSQGRQGETARIAAELESTYGRLLKPPPLWRRPALQMGAGAMIAAVVAWGFMPSGRYSVAVVSPGGEMKVAEVSRNGGAVGGLPLDVPEEAVVWRNLLPGHYVLTLENGTRGEFEIPGPQTVLLPSGEGDYTAELVKALGLDEPARQP